MGLTSIPGSRPCSSCEHSVHYYAEAYPAEAASEFITAGLRAGDACVVMLVEPHRRAVEQAMNARAIRTDARLRGSGSYVALDTTRALPGLLIDGRLDLPRATAALSVLLRPPPGSGCRRARLVGDPAPALFAAGNAADAIALEALVDRLAAAHGAAVFCAYPMQAFCREGHTQSIFRISAEHTSLDFPERLWVQGFLPAAPLVR